jgi:hypothetical protein
MKQVFKSFFDEFNFGKHKGEILDDVIEKNGQYIIWAWESGIIEIDKSIRDRVERKIEEKTT